MRLRAGRHALRRFVRVRPGERRLRYVLARLVARLLHRHARHRRRMRLFDWPRDEAVLHRVRRLRTLPVDAARLPECRMRYAVFAHVLRLAGVERRVRALLRDRRMRLGPRRHVRRAGLPLSEVGPPTRHRRTRHAVARRCGHPRLMRYKAGRRRHALAARGGRPHGRRCGADARVCARRPERLAAELIARPALVRLQHRLGGVLLRITGAPAPGTLPPCCANCCACRSWNAAGTTGLRVATIGWPSAMRGGW
ncbi:MAG: hypothetical protein GAK41_00739 [Burkholderia gladioli]|nr:MAG: hypothetical protein GAK41_00739 [Burkholderia gladioli]